jgi:hypothetical protein
LKFFSPKSSGIVRRSRRILLPEPASLKNLLGFVSDAGSELLIHAYKVAGGEETG